MEMSLHITYFYLFHMCCVFIYRHWHGYDSLIWERIKEYPPELNKLMNALIVDDEKEICFLLKYQLRKLGIESELAHNLADGLEKFSSEDHDLVFLDINLPDGNGLEAIPLLKRKKENVKVIVISAYNTESERNKASDLGADVFLGKPFNKLMITQVINNIKFNK